MPVAPDPILLSESTELSELVTEARNIFEILMSPELQDKLFLFKIVFIFILAGFIFVFIYLAFKTSYMEWKWINAIKNFLVPGLTKENKFFRYWKKLKKSLDKASTEPQWKVIIIEAFNFVNRFVSSETIGSLTKDDITDLGEFVEAYQTGKQTKQDINFQITKNQVEKIIEIFEKALFDLQVF